MLKMTEPPEHDWVGDWECLHRACIGPDDSDRQLSKVIPLFGGLTWCREFGDSIRIHKPRRTPLKLWRIASVSWDPPAQVSEETTWAFSKEMIELHLAWSHRQLVWAKQISPDGRE
jgi:hypothetical protein